MRFGLRALTCSASVAAGRDDVVGARLVQQVAARAKSGALDAIAAAIGEDVVADARHVAAAQIVPKRVVVVLLDRDDPHVDAVVAHRARQDLLELVEADLALHFPAPAGFLCGLHGTARMASNTAAYQLASWLLQSVTSHRAGFQRTYTVAKPPIGANTYTMNLHMLLVRLLVAAIFLSAPGVVLAQNTQNGGIDYDTARNERRLQGHAGARARSRSTASSMSRHGRRRRWRPTSCRTIRARASRRRSRPRCRLLYDDRALYIGVFAKDPEPGAIIINELRKDFNTGTADGFQVVIDTFHDERNGYQFAINPGGAKWDSQMSNEGREQNSNWDGIWDVGTRIGERRLVCGDRDSVQDAEVRPRGHADLGHQLPAAAAPPERKQLLVAAAPDSPVVARVDGGHLRRAAGTEAGREHPRQAVRACQLEQARRACRSTRISTRAST